MITIDQAIPGTKVKIPATKKGNTGSALGPFLQELKEAKYSLPYLLIEGEVYWHGERVGLAFDRAGTHHYLRHDAFDLDDLDLYKE